MIVSQSRSFEIGSEGDGLFSQSDRGEETIDLDEKITTIRIGLELRDDLRVLELRVKLLFDLGKDDVNDHL